MCIHNKSQDKRADLDDTEDIDGRSEYELQRAANVAANKRVLHSRGLGAVSVMQVFFE